MEGLHEIKVDIERAKDIHSLKGIATAMLAATEHAAEEITSLKEQLARTECDRDELSRVFTIEGNEIWTSNSFAESKIGDSKSHPSLFKILAHLAGKVKG